jgi:two-component system response regulator PilR (NtrC family)
MRILVVDDEKIKRVTLADDLGSEGHDVVTAADGADALRRLDLERFDLVVTDLKMPGIDGLELLKHIKQGPLADVAVILMTAYGSIPVAVEAVKLGAYDFITKPFRNEDLFPLIARLGRRRLPAEDAPTVADETVDLDQMLVGDCGEMRRVKRMIEVAARADANVLLCGETGAGKDLLASIIHRMSARRGFPFVKVACTLLPPQLIESELYGHEKGSFTGAEHRRAGRFELASGGTLYLDDVDDIPLEQQSKLLRAIEEKVFERVGGATSINANVRIIASTKRNLLEKVGEQTFRQDLYYRLDVLRIVVPPLRERMADIPALARHLLQRIARDPAARLDAHVLDALSRHAWPGNVRELYHALERAYLVGSGKITADLLTLGSSPSPSSPGDDLPDRGFQAAMDEAEHRLLESALRACDGNKTAAAAALGMRPSTFRDKLAKRGLG